MREPQRCSRLLTDRLGRNPPLSTGRMGLGVAVGFVSIVGRCICIWASASVVFRGQDLTACGVGIQVDPGIRYRSGGVAGLLVEARPRHCIVIRSAGVGWMEDFGGHTRRELTPTQISAAFALRSRAGIPIQLSVCLACPPAAHELWQAHRRSRQWKLSSSDDGAWMQPPLIASTTHD